MEINSEDAPNKLEKLLNMLEKGDDIIIKRDGINVARIKPELKIDDSFPDLKKFRESIEMTGKSLSQTVIDMREKERF